jgi:hypothetical protein
MVVGLTSYEAGMVSALVEYAMRDLKEGLAVAVRLGTSASSDAKKLDATYKELRELHGKLEASRGAAAA